MKNKIIVLSILIFLAGVSSFLILINDGYFDKNENKILSVEQPMLPTTVLAKETTEVKTPVVVKKAPVKKVAAKKKVVKKKKTVKKKKSVNLAPPPITEDTAPHSAKNRYN